MSEVASGKAVVCDGDELEPGLWKCLTEALENEGNYQITIKAEEKQVTELFLCHNGEEEYAQQCKAEGAGLENGKVAAFGKAPFRFMFPEAMSEDSILIEARGPDGTQVEMDGESMPGEKGCWICYYSPVVHGPHTVSIACGKYPIPGFPRVVEINNAERTFLGDIRVLNLAKTIDTWDKECVFRVEYPSAIPREIISVMVTYPSGTKVNCVKNADDIYERSFACGMPGQYRIDVTMNGSHVEGSPFVRRVGNSAEESAAKATVSGDGIISDMNTCGHVTDFILRFKCPESQLGISCVGPDGKPTLIDGMEVDGETDCWRVEYLPPIEGVYTISITVGDVHIPNSPFQIAVRQSIGGMGKLLVFFSSASGKREAQRDLNRLEAIFLAKGMLSREDFAPFFAVDMWERDAREELYRVAKSRDLPQIWINDYFVGGVNQLQELEDERGLDMLLEQMAEDAKKPKSDLEEHFLTSNMAGNSFNAAKDAVEGEDKCVIS